MLTIEATAACQASAVTKCPPADDEAPVLSGEGSGGDAAASGVGAVLNEPMEQDEEMDNGEEGEGEEMHD